MKKFKDIFGNEITDPFFPDIRQRLDQLKKRNRGRKHFSEEDKKEINAISEELAKRWKILKEEIDKIPISEQVRRIKINVGKIRPGLFETSLFGKKSLLDSIIFDEKRLFDTSIFDKKTLYSNRVKHTRSMKRH